MIGMIKQAIKYFIFTTIAFTTAYVYGIQAIIAPWFSSWIK